MSLAAACNSNGCVGQKATPDVVTNIEDYGLKAAYLFGINAGAGTHLAFALVRDELYDSRNR